MRRKNKTLLILLALILSLSAIVAACGKNEPAPETTGSSSEADAGESETGTELPDVAGKFTVGFARKECMPDGGDSVIMSNYGVKRYSTGYYNKIYVHCIAMTDTAGTTFLCYSLDISGTANLSVFNNIKTEIQKQYGIAPEYVHLPNTHNHSAVALGADGSECPANHIYIQKLVRVAVEVAGEALADRKEATIEVGTGQAEGLTYVRHYRMSDGSIRTDNYNSSYGKTVEYAAHANTGEPDRSIQLIRFNRTEGKDIVMVGFRSHNHLQGGSKNTDLMGGFPVAMMESMEAQDPEIYAVYYQQDAGRLNPTSHLDSESITEDLSTPTLEFYGEKLAGYALEGLKHMEPAETGLIKTVSYVFTGNTNRVKKELISEATVIYQQFQSGAITSSEGMKLCVEKNNELGLSYIDGLHSVYHCGAIISNSSNPATLNLTLHAVSIGPDIGLTYSAYEMFDSNGRYIREQSPFKLTMTICYNDGTNGEQSAGYLPDEEAWGYGCYEADRAVYAPGTAEQLADRYIELLKELKASY